MLGMPTFMTDAHFRFQGFEVIRDVGLDFTTHSLPSPLLEAVESLVDIHLGCFVLACMCELSNLQLKAIIKEPSGERAQGTHIKKPDAVVNERGIKSRQDGLTRTDVVSGQRQAGDLVSEGGHKRELIKREGKKERERRLCD